MSSVLRAEAAVATPVIGGAQGPAAGMSYRPKAWCAVGYEHADISFPLALDTDAACFRLRLSASQKGGDYLK